MDFLQYIVNALGDNLAVIVVGVFWVWEKRQHARTEIIQANTRIKLEESETQNERLELENRDRELELRMHAMVLEQAKINSEARERQQLQITDLSTQNNNLKSQVATLELSIERGRESHDRTIETLTAERKQHESQILSFDKTLEDYRSQLRAKDKVIAEQSREINTLTRQINDVTNRLEAMEKHLTDLDDKYTKERALRLEIQTERDKAVERAESLQKERDEIRGMFDDLKDQFEGMQDKVNAFIEREDELHSSERKLRRMFDNMSSGVLLADQKGVITQVNRAISVMFGYERDELLNMTVEQLMPERFREKHKGHRHSYLKQPRTRPMGLGMDLWALRKDGTEFPIEIGLNYMDANGAGFVTLAVITDISERIGKEKESKPDGTTTEQS